MSPHVVTAANAEQVWGWLQTRGGLACWESVNLSNLGVSWTTPRIGPDGQPTGKPNWQAGAQPTRIITDPADVVVSEDREVKRFRVAVRWGNSGLLLKVTDAGSRKIRAAVARAGEGAYHVFDYETQEAVILAPVRQTPIAEYITARQEHGLGDSRSAPGDDAGRQGLGESGREAHGPHAPGPVTP